MITAIGAALWIALCVVVSGISPLASGLLLTGSLVGFTLAWSTR